MTSLSVYTAYDKEIPLHNQLNLHVISQMEYGPRSWSVYYELNCVCFWCQCLGNESEGLAGTALGKEDTFRETSRALCLGSEGCGCSLHINTAPHSEAFPFPSSFMEWFLLRALLSVSKKGSVSFSKDKSKTYIRFSPYSTHSFFLVSLDFYFHNCVYKMKKFHFTSFSLLILFYVEVLALDLFLTCLSSFPLLKFKGTFGWKC